VGASFGSSGVGGLSGVVSYSKSSQTFGGTTSDSELFSLTPNFDVRAGRFTFGGVLGVTHAKTTSGDSSAIATSISLAPRVGVLIPLTKEFSLWPRVSVGGVYGQYETRGATLLIGPTAGWFVNADVSFVVALGSRLFATLGPNGGWSSFDYTSPDKSSGFHVGANAGLGLAF
jgi:hypothetical protein